MTAMDWIEILMKIFGGMGALLIGMRTLSDNLTKLAHSKLNTMLNKTANNRFACVGIGAIVTFLGQSSAFTTVMVVGLVNAGIMSLFQATAMIMGANIGTTFTAWIISLNVIDITIFLVALAAVGVFMTMFSHKERIKSVGSALAGLGLVFVGLTLMKGAMSFEVGTPSYNTISELLGKISNPFLLLFIGIAVTALVQSSTAVNAIIITMASSGLLIGGGAGNAMYFIIIGSNIGTCVTALISSIGAMPNAKRAALIHFLFNFFGALIFMVILLLWTSFADTLLTPVFPGLPAMRIALFHTLFNVVCTILFLPLINVFVKVANFIVPERKGDGQSNEVLTLELDDRLLRTPSVALGHLYQETGKTFTSAMNALDIAISAFLEKDIDAKEQVIAINSALAGINRQEVAYLVKLSATSPVIEDERTISSLHYVLNDIMRIGELADNITKYTNHYVNDGLVFSDEFLEMIETMYKKIKNLYILSLATFLYKDFKKLEEVDRLEDEIDKDRRNLVTKHIARLNEGKCQPRNSNIFINLVGNLERAADHITFIAHSIEQSS